MPGLFIDVELAPEAARDPALARKLAEACPVDIFEAGDEGVRIVEENLDECTLCDLCIQAAPRGAVRVRRLYGE
jgi:NAD-dependent dihydropyrimidine dehydrogenase PreA subunit